MRTPKIFAAAIVMMLATPVSAQQVGRAIGPSPGPYGYNDRYYRDDFWPGQVAGGIVGGAIGTAGAIATAPFRAMSGNGPYAMAPDASYCAQRYRSYDPASGTYMGYDGRRHPC
jgi:BA14K-like protein